MVDKTFIMIVISVGAEEDARVGLIISMMEMAILMMMISLDFIMMMKMMMMNVAWSRSICLVQTNFLSLEIIVMMKMIIAVK